MGNLFHYQLTFARARRSLVSLVNPTKESLGLTRKGLERTRESLKHSKPTDSPPGKKTN